MKIKKHLVEGSLQVRPNKNTNECSPSIIGVFASTNTPMGGDRGHGGKSRVHIQDTVGMTWEVHLVKNGETIAMVNGPDCIKIICYGDAEAEALIEALTYAARNLRQERKKHHE